MLVQYLYVSLPGWRDSRAGTPVTMIMVELVNAKFITILDLRSAFHQVALASEFRHETAAVD